MFTRRGLVLTLVLLLPALATPILAQTPPPAAQWVPQDAVLCLQVSRPKVMLDFLAGKEMTQTITSSPFYQSLSSQPKFQEFNMIVKFMETTLGTDWRTALAQLAGGGITIAVCPQDTVVGVIDAEDEQMLTRLHDTIVTMARGEAEKHGQPQKVASKEYGGVTAWTFDGKEAHAIIGKRVIFCNRAEGLKTILDLRAQSDAKSLAASSAFQAAKKANNASAAATVFVNLKPLLSIPGLAAALDGQRANPLAALVFASVAESVRNSNWLNLELGIQGKTLALRAVTDGKITESANPAAFALPQKAGDGAWPNIAVPGRIAAVSLYRDLRGFYAAKDTLFPDRTSGLIFFENMMGIFFTGRDLTTEVLAETEPEVRIVVAELQNEPAAKAPQVKIPAFAVVLRLRHPEQFNKVVEEAWQKAVGLINFTRGQMALPGLTIDRPVYKDTKYTVAYFAPADANDKTKPETGWNVRPSLAMPGKYLILSSTDGLARDLIDALSREGSHAVTPVTQTHSLLEIDANQAASILGANREAIVRGDMVKKGKSQQESEAGIDMMIGLVRLVDQVKLSLGTDQGLTQARLTLKLN
jgi:hypothetical protein